MRVWCLVAVAVGTIVAARASALGRPVTATRSDPRLVALARPWHRRVGTLMGAIGGSWFLHEFGLVYRPLPNKTARVASGLSGAASRPPIACSTAAPTAPRARSPSAGGAGQLPGKGLMGLKDHILAVGGALEVLGPRGRGTRPLARRPFRCDAQCLMESTDTLTTGWPPTQAFQARS